MKTTILNFNFSFIFITKCPSFQLEKSTLLFQKKWTLFFIVTAQKMKFSIKDFFSKCDQIHSFMRIWSHLLKKSLIESFIFVQCVHIPVSAEVYLEPSQRFMIEFSLRQ